MSKTVSKLLVIVAGFLVIGLLISGCDNPFAEDEDDGTLTVSVSGFTGTCGVGQDVLFAAFVYNAGADVMDDNVQPVALVGEMVPDTSASGAAFVWGDDARPTWSGKGGNSYDVYPTIYCTDGNAPDGTPLKNGNKFNEENPDWVYKSADFDQPVTYKQDGNKSIATAFGDYVVVP